LHAAPLKALQRFSPVARAARAFNRPNDFASQPTTVKTTRLRPDALIVNVAFDFRRVK
jgi:hypothetical protein